ncbi:MAG: hypothetical protein KIT34_00975 [Cyanobacteria bacterium TGS_CYA1]|nr:hypothetical protein [Cyanobacteria bacterium TGS_CYA1]
MECDSCYKHFVRSAVSVVIAAIVVFYNSAVFAQAEKDKSSEHLSEPFVLEMSTMGKPEFSEFRELLPKVISLSFRDQPYEGEDKLAQLKSRLNATYRTSRKIDIDLLQCLTDEYLKRNELNKALKSSVLLNLFFSRQYPISKAEEKRVSLEKIRNEVLNYYIQQFELAIHDHHYDSAKISIEKFIEAAKIGQGIMVRNDAVLPGQEKWPMITSDWLEYYIATKWQLEKLFDALTILTKANLAPRGLSLFDIEKAREIKSLPQALQDDAELQERKNFRHNKFK